MTVSLEDSTLESSFGSVVHPVTTWRIATFTLVPICFEATAQVGATEAQV